MILEYRLFLDVKSWVLIILTYSSRNTILVFWFVTINIKKSQRRTDTYIINLQNLLLYLLGLQNYSVLTDNFKKGFCEVDPNFPKNKELNNLCKKRSILILKRDYLQEISKNHFLIIGPKIGHKYHMLKAYGKSTFRG